MPACSIQVGLPTAEKHKQIKSYLKSGDMAEVLLFCCGDKDRKRETEREGESERRKMEQLPGAWAFVLAGNDWNLKGKVEEM